jgi:type IV secretory pathway VirB2 component (pilin)
MRRDRLSLYSVARRRNYFPLYVLALAAAVVVSPNLAHATTTGGSLPWDTPLQTLETDIKGPVAYGLALLGIVASGGMLIFVVLVAAIILGAASLLTTLFTTAALVS